MDGALGETAMTSRPSMVGLALGLVACAPMPGSSPGLPPLAPPADRLADAASAGATDAVEAQDGSGPDASLSGSANALPAVTPSGPPAAGADAAAGDVVGAGLGTASPSATGLAAPAASAAGPSTVGASGSAASTSPAGGPVDPFAAALAARSGPTAAPPAAATGSTASATAGGQALAPAGQGADASRVRWSPGDAGARWSVRLLRILPDVAPPRAVLGLPSGREIVVSPGTMIPEHDLVVMAIGTDAVQVDRIVADGDRTRVETEVLRPLNGTAR